ncbi:MAG: polyphosphate kinase 1 [Erysipelotrichaceae bacterium]
MWKYTQNREQSWLKFNERVLQEALDKEVPIWERIKFVAIYSSNLDEFFSVRVGSIMDAELLEEVIIDNKSGMTPHERIEKINKETTALCKQKDAIFEDIRLDLLKNGVDIASYKKLDKSEKVNIKQFFDRRILPVLSPQIIDSTHPFPHIPSKQIHIIVSLEKHGKEYMGLVAIPQHLKQLVTVNRSNRFILIEKLIYEFLDELFISYKVKASAIISITRSADIQYHEESFDMDEDYRSNMKQLLKKRTKLKPVKLDYSHKSDEKVIRYIQNKLSITKEQTFKMKSPLNMGFAFQMIDYFSDDLKEKLCYPPYIANNPLPSKYNRNPISFIVKKDVLLHYPYHSMQPFLRLLEKASKDPNVVSIKITIYRLAKEAKIIDYLCKASENGKEVIVIMELRARFDEQNNIDYSKKLEEADCKVYYGPNDYKIHSKVCLITYKNKGKINYITQVGTGNYNENTAKQYTDFSYITANQQIGEDANFFFKNILIGNLNGEYKSLLVAPNHLNDYLIEKMDEWIDLSKKEPVKMVFKVNGVTSIEMIKKLSEASKAGVEITLIVRGICCILPGIENETENIKIYSLVGKYLEHHRVYWFESKTQRKLYISSADLMTRNLRKRVEVACPIEDKQTQKEIMDIIHLILTDNTKRRELQSDGSYTPIEKRGNAICNAQEELEIHKAINENIVLKKIMEYIRG